MRLRNRTRTGNLCSQNIPWEWLHFGEARFFSVIRVLPCVTLRGIQTADLSARKPLDELGVIHQRVSGRLNSSSRKTNDSYGRPVACRRPISQVRFAEM